MPSFAVYISLYAGRQCSDAVERRGSGIRLPGFGSLCPLEEATSPLCTSLSYLEDRGNGNISLGGLL